MAHCRDEDGYSWCCGDFFDHAALGDGDHFLRGEIQDHTQIVVDEASDHLDLFILALLEIFTCEKKTVSSTDPNSQGRN